MDIVLIVLTTVLCIVAILQWAKVHPEHLRLYAHETAYRASLALQSALKTLARWHSLFLRKVQLGALTLIPATVKWLGRLLAFLLVISLVLVPVGLAVALVVTDRLLSLEGLETQIMIVYTFMVAGVIPLVFVLWSLHIRSGRAIKFAGALILMSAAVGMVAVSYGVEIPVHVVAINLAIFWSWILASIWLSETTPRLDTGTGRS